MTPGGRGAFGSIWESQVGGTRPLAHEPIRSSNRIRWDAQNRGRDSDKFRRDLDAFHAEMQRKAREAAEAVRRRRAQQQPDTVQAGGVPGPYDQPLSAATRWVPS